MNPIAPRATCVAGLLVLLLSLTRLGAADQTVPVNGNIQAAIDACAASGGGIVTIGSGYATMPATLRMKSNVTLRGAGNPATTLNSGGDRQTIGRDSEGLSAVAVQNMKIVGRGMTGSTACQGIYIDALATPHNGVSVSGVQITNFAGIGCHLKRANNTSVAAVNFHNNGKDLLGHNLYVHTSNSLHVTGSQLNNSPFGTGYRHTAGVGCSIKTTTSNGNGQNGQSFWENPSNQTVDGCTSNDNRNATPGRSDGIGINIGVGTGTVRNNQATGNRVNYVIGAGYAQSNNL
jgi:hypothetical protein